MASPATSSPRILLLGAHGKVSLLLTPLLLSRSWNLTSVIRDRAQEKDILAAAAKAPEGPKKGKLEILVRSLEDVKSQADAKAILDEARPDWVVWSAGAGGKGGSERTYAIDRDACIHFIRSSIATPQIRKFLLVSYFGARRGRAPWWNDEDLAAMEHTNTAVLPHYYKAKLAADEALTVLGEERRARDGNAFSYLVFRPGTLTDAPPTGKVAMGRIAYGGAVTRADVADVAARLLEKDAANGWFDLVGGEADVEEEVERVVREGIDAREGESLEEMKKGLEI